MIKFFILLIILLFNYKFAISRNVGETEITTEDGIEVFQEDKYYLLKKNVEILSDEFNLTGQLVKIFFEQDLYDVKELIASDSVNFLSEEYNIRGKGEELRFNIKNQKIIVNGVNSELLLEKTKMLSDGKISVDNIKGSFFIQGSNSKLLSDNIYISGSKINGEFEIIDGKRNIANLVVEDDKKLNIKTDGIIMYAKKAIYDKKNSIIELFENVKIERGSEIITGDYGILNTKNKSYKVSSKNSNKVKAIITNTNE
jgi:lipopolysaccharide export system protein LptA